MAHETEARTFAAFLEARGLHAALGFLNGRTPHRCTGVYRYDGALMTNVIVFDRMEPGTLHGIDVAVTDAYCAQVVANGGAFEFRETRLLARGQQRPANPVVCYCGVVIPDADGKVWGTLCHYDFKPCQMRKSDIPLLQAVAPLVYRYAAVAPALQARGSPRPATG